MTAREPLVSIVIPCYNQAHFLGEAIESVLGQTYRRFEIIVVDDGSRDNTAEVAAGYPGVRCIRQKNRGLAGARNTGLHASAGNYLVFLDADDRLLPCALATNVSCMEAHPTCAFVYGRYRNIAIDGSPLPAPQKFQVGRDHYLALLQVNCIGMHAAVMYRQAIFERVAGFDTSLAACEDYDLYLRIARNSPVCHHDAVVAEYRQHGTNMSRDPGLMLKTIFTVLRSQWNCVKGKDEYERAYRDGIRFGACCYGIPLCYEVWDNLQAHNWRRALQGMAVLVRWSPQAFPALTSRGVSRGLQAIGLNSVAEKS